MSKDIYLIIQIEKPRYSCVRNRNTHNARLSFLHLRKEKNTQVTK